MKKIAFLNGKGGTGKTTTAILTALAAGENGFRVGMIDTDPQESATAWVSNVKPQNVHMYKKGEQYRLLLVDTPPRLEEIKKIVPREAPDTIVVVTTLSPSDILTTDRTLKTLHELGLGKRACLLINQYQPNTRLAKTEDELIKSLGFPKLKNRIGSRQAYKLAMLQGWPALGTVERSEVTNAILEMIGR